MHETQSANASQPATDLKPFIAPNSGANSSDIVARSVRRILKEVSATIRARPARKAAVAGVDRSSYVRFLKVYRPCSFAYLHRVAGSMTLPLSVAIAGAEEIAKHPGSKQSLPKSKRWQLCENFDPSISKHVERVLIQRIKLICLKRGISQSELARRTGFHRSSISRLGCLSHDHSFILLCTISAQGLGIPFSSLVKAAMQVASTLKTEEH